MSLNLQNSPTTADSTTPEPDFVLEPGAEVLHPENESASPDAPEATADEVPAAAPDTPLETVDAPAPADAIPSSAPLSEAEPAPQADSSETEPPENPPATPEPEPAGYPHLALLIEAIGPEYAAQFDWLAETGSVQTYEHRETFRFIHYDSETGEFLNQQRSVINPNAALAYALPAFSLIQAASPVSLAAAEPVPAAESVPAFDRLVASTPASGSHARSDPRFQKNPAPPGNAEPGKGEPDPKGSEADGASPVETEPDLAVAGFIRKEDNLPTGFWSGVTSKILPAKVESSLNGAMPLGGVSRVVSAMRGRLRAKQDESDVASQGKAEPDADDPDLSVAQFMRRKTRFDR